MSEYQISPNPEPIPKSEEPAPIPCEPSDDPIPKPEEPAAIPSEPSDDPIQTDPLLGSDSFIEPGRNDSGPETPFQEKPEPKQNVELDSGAVIDAKPISMIGPGEGASDATPKVAKRKDPEEMAKRPDWLQDDWKVSVKVRSSGATAGTVDRYYIDPSGAHKFRSKNEVLRFIESGKKPSKKRGSGAEAGPAASPASPKQKKSSVKRKKSG